MLTAIASAWNLAKRIPREVWLIAAALAALWLWGNHREQRGRYEGRAEITAKWDRAKADALAATQAEEKRQAALSKGADRAVIESRIANRNTVEHFIAAGGVRPSRTNQAAVPSTGSGEALHQAPVMDDAERVQTVAVTPDDVRICTDNTIFAEAWRELLLGLEK